MWPRRQKACQSLEYCLSHNVSVTTLSLRQWPHNVRKCPTMSGGGIKQADQRPAGLIHENGETFEQSRAARATFHKFIHTTSDHFKMNHRLSKHWNSLMFQITGTKNLWLAMQEKDPKKWTFVKILKWKTLKILRTMSNSLDWAELKWELSDWMRLVAGQGCPAQSMHPVLTKQKEKKS